MDDVDLSNNPLIQSRTTRTNFGVINVSSMWANQNRIGWKTRPFDGSWNNIDNVVIDRDDDYGIAQVSQLT